VLLTVYALVYPGIEYSNYIHALICRGFGLPGVAALVGLTPELRNWNISGGIFFHLRRFYSSGRVLKGIYFRRQSGPD
jgi:hypothetical protein